jgi:hypothetical protein
MRHKPSGLIRYFESPFQLQGGDAFFREANQVYCQKPLVQRRMGVVEDAASGDAEIVLTINALEQLPHLSGLSCGLIFEHADAATLNAADTVRPADFLIVSRALFLSGKPRHGLEDAWASLGLGSHNGEIIPQC